MFGMDISTANSSGPILVINKEEIKSLLIFIMKDVGFINHEHAYQNDVHQIIKELQEFADKNDIKYI